MTSRDDLVWFQFRLRPDHPRGFSSIKTNGFAYCLKKKRDSAQF
jgi:hypothetical protein